MAESEKFSMSMGPNGNVWCCGKPVGCDMRNPRCSFLHHRWKMQNVPGWKEYLDEIDRARREAEVNNLDAQAEG